LHVFKLGVKMDVPVKSPAKKSKMWKSTKHFQAYEAEEETLRYHKHEYVSFRVS